MNYLEKERATLKSPYKVYQFTKENKYFENLDPTIKQLYNNTRRHEHSRPIELQVGRNSILKENRLLTFSQLKPNKL